MVHEIDQEWSVDDAALGRNHIRTGMGEIMGCGKNHSRKNVSPADCPYELQKHCLEIKKGADKFNNLFRCPVVARD